MADARTSCGVMLPTGHGTAEVCILAPHPVGTWHQGSAWPHGKAVQWIEAQTRTVDAPYEPQGRPTS